MASAQLILALVSELTPYGTTLLDQAAGVILKAIRAGVAQAARISVLWDDRALDFD